MSEPEEIRSSKQCYYQEHRIGILERKKVYYREHQIEIREKQAEYKKIYWHTPRGKQIQIDIANRMAEKYPEKHKARQMLRNAVMLGYVKKGPCEVCGEIKVEAHHDDYSKPFEVCWLCPQHHRELEGRCVLTARNI